jgi:hypothetical protein
MYSTCVQYVARDQGHIHTKYCIFYMGYIGYKVNRDHRTRPDLCKSDMVAKTLVRTGDTRLSETTILKLSLNF